jgi:hypothetical protein
MAGGAFGSVNVKTHWLLNDISGAFARGEFLKFEFLDGIRRQRSVFSTGEVVINRSEEDWSWNGETLPRYGFIARAAGGLEAAVVARDGVRYAYSKRPGRWFVDARAPIGDGIPSVVNSSPASFEMLSPSRARLKLNWRTNSEITDDFRPFCHIIPLTNTSVISHHARIVGIDGKVRKEPGDHKGVYIDISLPAKVQSGDYSIRYGMFSPKGPRLRISGCNDRSYRIRAGVLSIAANGNSSPAALAWRNERTTDRDRELGINSELKPVDFGGIRTFGSFRFDFPKPGFKAAAKRLFRREKPEWRITPLPGSMPFAAEIDLARFGGKGVKVAAVEPVDPTKYAAKPIWRQQGDKLHLDLDANSFAYRIIAE